MIILPKSVFIHIPKTGGNWVREALINSIKGGPVICYYPNNNHHPTVDDIPAEHKHKPTFCFVRDPLDWYASYWRWRITEGWQYHQTHPFDIDCADNDYSEFIRKVIQFHPGFSSRLQRSISCKCSIVGLFEYLTEDLVRCLKTVGEEFVEEEIHSTLPQNVSNKSLYQMLSSVLKGIVYEKERIHGLCR